MQIIKATPTFSVRREPNLGCWGNQTGCSYLTPFRLRAGSATGPQRPGELLAISQSQENISLNTSVCSLFYVPGHCSKYFMHTNSFTSQNNPSFSDEARDLR